MAAREEHRGSFVGIRYEIHCGQHMVNSSGTLCKHQTPTCSYTWINVQLTDKQRQQVDAIASLVTQGDPNAIRQGIELTAALDDQAVFAALLSGISANLSAADTPKGRFPSHRRFPTPDRASLFDVGTGDQALLDLAMIQLLAASDHPLRTSVTSIALGTPKRKFAKPPRRMWLHGLERLTELTHLDLHFTALDEGLDMSVLKQFRNLTHLRFRGAFAPGPLPSMPQLQEINAVRFGFEPGAEFPELRFVRGRIESEEPLDVERMPKLNEVEVRGDLRLRGFTQLKRVWSSRGEVDLGDCEQVGHLRVGTHSFEAPKLRHVGLLDQITRGLDIAQLETIDRVKLTRSSKIRTVSFPPGTQLIDPRVVLWGPELTDLGNVGELEGMEMLIMPRVRNPVSLEPLRKARSLRVLDIRNSPGITDLSPLIELPNLEVLVIDDVGRKNVPPELADKVQKFWRRHQPRTSAQVKSSAGRTTKPA